MFLPFVNQLGKQSTNIEKNFFNTPIPILLARPSRDTEIPDTPTTQIETANRRRTQQRIALDFLPFRHLSNNFFDSVFFGFLAFERVITAQRDLFSRQRVTIKDTARAVVRGERHLRLGVYMVGGCAE